MSSALYEIPPAKRQRLAGALGLLAVLLIAIGAVAVAGADSAPLTVFGAIAFVVAVLLALLAWGVLVSIRNERLEREHQTALDSVLAEALAASSGTAAVREFNGHGCGHDHDPDELHVSGDACAHDGGGAGCSHTCETCVFARLRPVDDDGHAAPVRPRPTPSGGR